MDSADLFIDWSGEFHTPAYLAIDGLPIVPGFSTVLDLLNAASRRDPSFQFTKTGEGANAWLTSIGGVANNQQGNGYYWVFFVNGVMPQKGCGACVLDDNASVAWDYKHYSSGFSQANQEDHPLYEALPAD